MIEIMNVAVCEGLRKIFKQEWDKHYGATKGVWDDTFKSGNELYNMEKSRRHAKPYLNLYQSGKRSEWDSSALSDAILYSNALRAHLAPYVSNKVDELRKLRNNLTHVHGPQNKIANTDFDKAYKKIQNCFKVLKLSTESSEEILNSWKRKILVNVKNMTYVCLIIFLAGLLSSASYYWYTNSRTVNSLMPFRSLPVRPIHLVANRSQTVNAILEELQSLSIRNDRSLTCLYISGNPGSGKSQLARLVGQQYGLDSSLKGSLHNGNVFVMTLKATSVQSILESYAEFARRVDCDGNIVMNIMNSDKTKTGRKIQRLKTEIAKILNNVKKKSWLLIVDNVANLQEISLFLPQLEDEDWHGGQVLITTQDMSSVPPNSSLTVHISVSEGMDPVESCEFLTGLSGLVENQELVGKVAKELDYQPLALASAAFFVKLLRENQASSHINWRDYLNKLEEGKRNLTEMKLTEVNKPAYSLTMSTAVLLAVATFAESNPVLKHAFTFFSFVSHEHLALDGVVSYVHGVDKEKDKDDVRLMIVQCSLILISHDQKVVSVFLHRIVHNSIKDYIAFLKTENKNKPHPPLNILQLLIDKKCALGEIALIPHLKEFYVATKNLSSEIIAPRSKKSAQIMQEQILKLTLKLISEGEWLLAKRYLILCDEISTKGYDEDEDKNKDKSKAILGEIHHQLGAIENIIGDCVKARNLVENAFKILSKEYEFTDERVSRCLDTLSDICSCSHDCHDVDVENIIYSQKAPSIDASLETKSKYYLNLGLIYRINGHWRQAMKNFRQAIDVLREIINVPGASSLTPYETLATTYMLMGDSCYHLSEYELVKRYFNLSIFIINTIGRPDHPSLAELYHHLGLVHHTLNELSDAENCLRHSRAIYTQYWGPSHKKNVVVNQDLAAVLKENGQLEEAALLDKQYGRLRR